MLNTLNHFWVLANQIINTCIIFISFVAWPTRSCLPKVWFTLLQVFWRFFLLMLIMLKVFSNWIVESSPDRQPVFDWCGIFLSQLMIFFTFPAPLPSTAHWLFNRPSSHFHLSLLFLFPNVTLPAFSFSFSCCFFCALAQGGSRKDEKGPSDASLILRAVQIQILIWFWIIHTLPVFTVST